MCIDVRKAETRWGEGEIVNLIKCDRDQRSACEKTVETRWDGDSQCC